MTQHGGEGGMGAVVPEYPTQTASSDEGLWALRRAEFSTPEGNGNTETT
jgi:hypothetical protein